MFRRWMRPAILDDQMAQSTIKAAMTENPRQKMNSFMIGRVFGSGG